MTDKLEITPKFLADLKAKAKKATQGEWNIFVEENSHASWVVSDLDEDIDICEVFNISGEDAAYIAAANPAVVLALIEKIERLEEDFEAAARSAADESVKAVKLEKEADWLAEQLLCCTDDNRVDTCSYESCRHLCTSLVTTEGWRNAAREAAAKKAAEDAAHNPE